MEVSPCCYKYEITTFLFLMLGVLLAMYLTMDLRVFARVLCSEQCAAAVTILVHAPMFLHGSEPEGELQSCWVCAFLILLHFTQLLFQVAAPICTPTHVRKSVLSSVLVFLSSFVLPSLGGEMISCCCFSLHAPVD